MSLSKYTTLSAHLSGGICGEIGLPMDATCGILFSADLRRDGFNHFSDRRGTTFRDVLLSILTRDGGDFQNPEFTDDTVIRVERRRSRAPGQYDVHVKEILISDLPDCADLVRSDVFISDFFDEERAT